MMKYRIIQVTDDYGDDGYCLEYRYWWWPFWLSFDQLIAYDMIGPRVFSSPDEAVNAFMEYKKPNPPKIVQTGRIKYGH